MATGTLNVSLPSRPGHASASRVTMQGRGTRNCKANIVWLPSSFLSYSLSDSENVHVPRILSIPQEFSNLLA